MSANILSEIGFNAVTAAGNTWATAISGTGGLTAVNTATDGANMVTAILQCVSVSGSGNVTIKIQESNTTTSGDFADLSTPATFTAISAAQDLQIISFKATKQYVRGYATLNSGTSVTAVLTFLWQRHTTPANNGGWVNDAAPTA